MSELHELLELMRDTFDRCLKTVEAKSQDYTGDGDVFSTFRLSETVGVSVPRAILVRIMDKIGRVSSLIDGRLPKVKDEKLEDTLTDLCAYIAILKAYLELTDKDDVWTKAAEKCIDLGYPAALVKSHQQAIDDYLCSRLSKANFFGIPSIGYVYRDGRALEDAIGDYFLTVKEKVSEFSGLD